MARPARSLEQHVRQGSFRSRRHHPLLAGEPLPSEWRLLAGLQTRYEAATSEPERAAIGLQFEQAVTHVHAKAKARDDGLTGPGLDEQLTTLGKRGSLAHLLAFFPACLRGPSGHLCEQPFELEPWQRAFLREFQRRDRTGQRLYKKALLGLPSGNGKTTLAAGLGLYELLCQPDAPQIAVAAGSREQARLGIDCAHRMIEQSPLSEWLTCTSHRLDCPRRRASMQAISSQGAVQHGRIPAAALLDELWTFTSRQQVETYTALTSAVYKRPDAYLLATSTAGKEPDSLLGRIYQDALSWNDVTVRHHGCLTIAKNPDAGALLWWYGAPAGADPADPKILRACNPASWISVSDLQQQLRDPGLSESDFRRLHLNQWTHTARTRPKRTTATSRPGSTGEELSSDEIFAQIEARTRGGTAAILGERRTGSTPLTGAIVERVSTPPAADLEQRGRAVDTRRADSATPRAWS
jgi:terminase large subunit-like protein